MANLPKLKVGKPVVRVDLSDKTFRIAYISKVEKSRFWVEGEPVHTRTMVHEGSPPLFSVYQSSRHWMEKACEMAIKDIGAQFPRSPEGKLALAVVGEAIRNSCGLGASMEPGDVGKAIDYLDHRNYWASLAGVDPKWVRTVCKRWGVYRGGK